LALSAPGVDRQSLFVSDGETVTWADFYRPLVSAAGRCMTDVHNITVPDDMRETARERLRTWLADMMETKTARDLKPRVPRSIVRVYKGLLALAFSPATQPNAFASPPANAPELSQDLSLLQQCAYKLPNTKAEHLLRYRPIVSFDEGMRRSIAWLEFAESAAVERR
jgi:hypothetical protein